MAQGKNTSFEVQMFAVKVQDSGNGIPGVFMYLLKCIHKQHAKENALRTSQMKGQCCIDYKRLLKISWGEKKFSIFWFKKPEFQKAKPGFNDRITRYVYCVCEIWALPC